jgi:hypothetical protein
MAVTLPIRALLDGTLALADVAVRTAGADFVGDVAALVERHVDDVDRLVSTAFLDVPGRHCVQSSWAGFALYDLDWGVLLGRIAVVRAPSLGVINGLQVVLPTLPGGGLEVLVGVEEGCLDRLLHEPLWNRFAKAR